MGKVIQLSDTLIRQIAAGEVIAEPVSIVKEAIENSIDAGANEIQVDITNGGISSIVISDNGSGIALEDLKLITSRHSTSKIKTEADLVNILTLGFRGEFLASLLAAADQTIITKERSEERGHKVTYTIGKEPMIEPSSRSIGTMLLVNNLFDKIPARRNFLPKAKTSTARIYETIRQFTLAYEKIRFIFRSDGEEKFRSQPGTKLNAMTMVFGPQTAKNLLPIQRTSEDERWRVEGFISKPSEVRATRSSQYFIVNGRIIENELLDRAVTDGYGNFVAPRKYPIVVLYLHGPPEDYDANVHPAKKEIRLKSEKTFYAFIQKSVYETLVQSISGSGGTAPLSLGSYSQKTFEHLAQTEDKSESKKTETERNVRKKTPKEQSADAEDSIETADETVVDDFEQEESENQSFDSHPLEDTLQYFYDRQQGRMGNTFFQHIMDKKEIQDLVPLTQLDKTFILAVHKQHTEDLYIIDQHAVAERITLEKIVYATKSITKQTLLEPIDLLLTPEEEVVLQEIIPIITKHGYAIKILNNLQAHIEALPIYQYKKISKDQAVYNLREILAESIKVKVQKGSLSGAEQEIIKSLACHNSIRAGETLSHQDMKTLLQDMIQAKFPYVCCHGRPSIFKIPGNKLHQLFWRT